MDRIIDLLNTTIKNKAKERILQCPNFIKIKENNLTAKLKLIEFINLEPSDKIFGFSLDLPSKQSLSYFFDRKNVNKGCDGVIFFIRNSKLNIFLCELKSDHPKKRDFENQLLSSEVFIFYLIRIFKCFDSFDVDDKMLKIKKLLFTTKNINKFTLNPKKINFKKIRNNIYQFDCSPDIDNKININELINL